MKRPLILIAALSGTLALAACDSSSDKETTANQNAENGASETSQAEEKRETLTLEGTLTQGEKVSLPVEAEITVQLLDITLDDDPETVVAEQTFTAEEEMLPLPFTLDYPADTLSTDHPHALRAEVHDADDRLLWASAERREVEVGADADQGPVELMLERVEGDAAAPLEAAAEKAGKDTAQADDAQATDEDFQASQESMVESEDTAASKTDADDASQDLADHSGDETTEKSADKAAGDDEEDAVL